MTVYKSIPDIQPEQNKLTWFMQPYFFPYLGYFALINANSEHIVFDTPQYVNRSWMNRNRISNPNKQGWVYFTVPVKKHHLSAPINSILIQNAEPWKEKLFGKLGYYKRKAPYFNEVLCFLEKTLNHQFDSLLDLNISTLKSTCNYLGIDFEPCIFSDMNIDLEPVSDSDEWGLNLCKSLDLKRFIYPEGGIDFVNREKYQRADIDLSFIKYRFPAYDQFNKQFIPRLSIIDVMMFNAPDEIRPMLDDYILVK